MGEAGSGVSEAPDRPTPAQGSVSASVLRALLENPIDRGYTKEAHQAVRGPWQRVVAALLIVVLSAASLWAAKDLRRARVGASSANSVLRQEVVDDLALQEELQGQIAALNADILATHSDNLDMGGEGGADASQLGMLAGTLPVAGPGIVISLDDTAAVTSAERIKDFDLQVLVNALWASGAEAIAVDGQRLSTASAIRNAGEAVMVNLTPLSSPYVVEAIGDPTSLQVRLARTRAAGHLAVLRDTYGVSVTIDAADELVLPAAPSRGIEYAEPLEPEEAADVS